MGQGNSKGGVFAEGLPIVAPPQGQLGAMPNYIDQHQARTWVVSSSRPAKLTTQDEKAAAAATASSANAHEEGDSDTDDEENLEKPSAAPGTNSSSNASRCAKPKQRIEPRKYFVSDPANGTVAFTLRRRSYKGIIEDIVIADAEGRPLYRAIAKHGWKSSFGTFHAYAYNEEARAADPNANDNKKKQDRDYLVGLAQDEADETPGARASFTISVRYRTRIKLNIAVHILSDGGASTKLEDDPKASLSRGLSEQVHMQMRMQRSDGVLLMQQNGERVMTKKEREKAAKEDSLAAHHPNSSSAGALPYDDDEDPSEGKKKHFWSKKGSKDSDDEDEDEDEESQVQALGGQPLLKLGTVQSRKDAGFFKRTFFPSWDVTVAPGIDPTMIATSMVVAQIVAEQAVAASGAAGSTAATAAVVSV